jgi:hypothetical protein
MNFAFGMNSDPFVATTHHLTRGRYKTAKAESKEASSDIRFPQQEGRSCSYLDSCKGHPQTSEEFRLGLF